MADIKAVSAAANSMYAGIGGVGAKKKAKKKKAKALRTPAKGKATAPGQVKKATGAKSATGKGQAKKPAAPAAKPPFPRRETPDKPTWSVPSGETARSFTKKKRRFSGGTTWTRPSTTGRI